jgi:hypothetical protein
MMTVTAATNYRPIRPPMVRGFRRAKWCRITLVSVTLACGLIAWTAASAEDTLSSHIPLLSDALANDEKTPASNPKPDLSAKIEARKSYSIPAFEILGEELLLNQINRRSPGGGDYMSNMSTVRSNLRSSWVTDDDPFKTNQLGHPYQGSIYHGFARSAGLNYWEALGYDFAGSALWEIAGERIPPSKNDQINTTFGGSFLGEALFRMSSLVLEHGNNVPNWGRETGAAVISPPTGFNRMAFRSRLNSIFSSRDPEYYSRLQLGFSGTAHNGQDASTTTLKRNEALIDYSMDYGLPGKPGYSYTRPFDYFNFQATASSANGFENVMTRGLLVGKDYEEGKSFRGVWGLYGSYDYIAPQIFRISTQAVSLGSNGQWQLSDLIALQGSGLLGVGYAAAGSNGGGTSETNYHYGVAPQALISTRVILGDRASFDVTAREYFVNGAATGYDNIVRLDASFSVRVHQQNAITIKYLLNRRDASFPGQSSVTQSRGTIGIFYTFMGHSRFGAVDWK